ncbi:MAG: hemerythrin domain-containing protein [Pseudomonadota bacterium]
MSALLARLRRDHTAIRLFLQALEAKGAALDQGEAVDYAQVRDLTANLRSAGANHHPCEHSVLALLQVRAPQAAAKMADMPEDHERLDRERDAVDAAMGPTLVAERGAQTDAARDGALGRRVSAAIDDLVADQRDHMAREEADFFPAAERHLTLADWRLAEAFCARYPAAPHEHDEEDAAPKVRRGTNGAAGD